MDWSARSSLNEHRPKSHLDGLSWLLVILLAIQVVLLAFFHPERQISGKLDWLLIATGTALAVTLVGLVRRLPFQNVVLAAFVIGATATVWQALVLAVGGVVGPMAARENGFSWIDPILWIVAILNSRGAASFMLQPWRAGANFGLKILATSIVLATTLRITLLPFVARIGPGAGGRPPEMTWLGLLLETAGACLFLILLTPVVLHKKPIERSPDPYPLITWTLLALLGLRN